MDETQVEDPRQEWAAGEGVRGITVSLVSDHLALAVEFLSESCRWAGASWHWMQSHRYAMSSILHSFLALESGINLVGYKWFFDPESPTYVPPEKRDIPLRLMTERWWTATLSWRTKLRYILSVHDRALEPTLDQELLECARMRNLIAHGHPHERFILLEGERMGLRVVVDQEIKFDAKFSNTKLKAPAFVDHEDAQIVVRVVLEALRVLATATGEEFTIHSMNKNQHMATIGRDFDTDGFLEAFLGEGAGRQSAYTQLWPARA